LKRKCIAGFWLGAIVAPAALPASTPLPDGPAKRTVEIVCSGCHSLDVITNKKWDRQQWQGSVKVMKEFGARLTKEQASDVVNYLVKNFGNQDRGKELVEDVCTYCHGLQKLEGQERSREEWRDLIKGMIFEGAPVTDEEFSLTLDYLAKNFGKKD
jgi:cytochrome c5